MVANRYFNHYPTKRTLISEMNLVEDVMVECIEMMGHNIYYIPRESFDGRDMIFGESTKVKFDKAYMIEAYIANINGFEGDQDFFSKFGLEVRDTSNFILSRRSFLKLIPTTIRQRPQEGDILWVPVMNRLFEIKFIEEELGFFQMGNRNPYIYQMRCEQFRYSMEHMETGIDEIDAVEEENAYTIRLNLETTGIGSFNDGELVYQSSNGNMNAATAWGHVKEWFGANGTILIYNPSGTFVSSKNIIGNSSKAIYGVVSTTDTKSNVTDRDLYDNELFDTEATLILDLSEINPFGVP